MGVPDRFKLDGRTALVTGCRRGIGRGLAEGLAEAGADIIGVSTSLAPGSKVEQAVVAAGRRFTAYRCDFRDREALYAFIERVKADCPPVDILVNNAGTIRRGAAEEYSDEDWDAVLEVNLNAQFILAREFGREMLKRGRGKIIFTASLLSYQGGITVPSYAAAKAGVAALTRALANEWASRGVNVNAVAPGYIATDMTRALQDDAERGRAILERIPAGRWGTPEDLKGALVFLASEASDYVDGTVLLVDGGWMGR